MQDQHIVANGTPVGLNLAAVFPVLDAMGIDKDSHLSVVEKLLIMHRETVDAIKDKK